MVAVDRDLPKHDLCKMADNGSCVEYIFLSALSNLLLTTVESPPAVRVLRFIQIFQPRQQSPEHTHDTPDTDCVADCPRATDHHANISR